MKGGHELIITPRSYGAFIQRVVNAADAHPAPHGVGTTEVIGATAVLRNPLDRVVTAAARRNNIAFGVAEWLALMTGVDGVDFYTHFIKSYGKYSTDGATVDGAYGTRVRYTEDVSRAGWEPAPGDYLYRDQVRGVEDKLLDDLHSRQAVIAIYNAEDLFGGGGVNTPCTLSLQFLARGGRLHAIVTMRSSDVVKGLTYDLFMFTMLQEFLARRLGLELGVYLHRAGSLHLYDYDAVMARDMLANPRWPLLMERMPMLQFADLDLACGLVMTALDNPSSFGSIFYVHESRFSTDDAYRYLRQLAAVMVAFASRDANRPASMAAFTFVKDRTLRTVLRPWLKPKAVTP